MAVTSPYNTNALWAKEIIMFYVKTKTRKDYREALNILAEYSLCFTVEVFQSFTLITVTGGGCSQAVLCEECFDHCFMRAPMSWPCKCGKQNCGHKTFTMYALPTNRPIKRRNLRG